MQTLIEEKIGPLGKTTIESDAKPEQLQEGRADVLRFSPEQGQPIVWAAVASQEEAHTLRILFEALDQRSNGATSIRTFVEDQVGRPVDWASLVTRYEKAEETF